MTENQDNKKIEDRGENLLDITIKFIKNERPKNESKNILNIAVEKLKSKKKSNDNLVIEYDKQTEGVNAKRYLCSIDKDNKETNESKSIKI